VATYDKVIAEDLLQMHAIAMATIFFILDASSNYFAYFACVGYLSQ